MITKELEKAGLPVAYISAMYALAIQLYSPRVIQGIKIPYPCGDPTLADGEDRRLRREIVLTALKTLRSEVTESTLFRPNVTFVFA